MSEIAARTIAIVWEAAAAAGVDTTALEPALPLTPEEMIQPRRRARWDQLVETIELLEAHGCGPRKLEEIGHRIIWTPSYGFVRRLAPALVTPQQLYLASFRWIRPLLFPHLEGVAREAPGGRIALDGSIPEGYRASRGFFSLVKGSAAALPELLGLPPAEVSAAITPRRIVITITPPPAPSRLWRLHRTARAILSPGRLIEELGRQQEEIRDSWLSATRAQRNLEEVIAGIPDAVIVHRDGVVLYANPAMVHALDLASSSDLVDCALLECIHPDDRGAARQHLLEVPTSDCDARSQTLRVTRADGEPAQLEFSAGRHITFEGRPAILSVARDVTERWRVTEQLARADRLSSLGRLAAGVAHELNNPLAYIEMNLHLIGRALHGGDEHQRRKARQALDSATHGIDRAKTIVRDLSTFSRPELETMEPLDLHPVIDGALRMLRKQLEHRVTTERDYAATGKVMANRARIEQVFLNILLNAIQAFSSDDPAINRIRITTGHGDDGRIVVTIEDNGSGIPSSHQGRIFDPFFTTKPVGDGTGLGLAICHGIVARLGGEIGFESTPGQGSTFTVSMPPLRRPAAPSRPRRSSARSSTSRRARVLVIDDEPALARALESLIEDVHDVETATSGRKALTLLRERSYDVVFCDLMMVDFSGMDLYHELDRTQPDILDSIVFMTGGAFTQQARDFLDRVSNRCLHKPFRLHKVLRTIEESLARASDDERTAEISSST